MARSEIGTGPSFTVIVPNRNGAATLRPTLQAIFATGYRPLEVIVVDDASSDESRQIAREFGVNLLVHESCLGAARTRNTGAAAAGGEILVFVDNDVVIPPAAFEILSGHFRNPGIAGVIGLLKPVTRYHNLCSQYKNFYMHYTYSKMPEPITVFYTSIASLRREVFQACGGFDPQYRSATIEDMEFGLRVTDKGYRLAIDRGLQVEHIKYYSLGALLRTEFRRAAGLAKIALRDRLRRKQKMSYTTTSFSFLAGMVLSCLGLGCLIIYLLFPCPCFLVLALGSFLAVIGLNLSFLRGFARHTRPGFFWLGSGLILADLLAHGFGVVWGGLSFLRGRDY